MKKYRNEWKYALSDGKLKLLDNRLRSVMSLDEHANSEGKYIVHSLYFDSYKNICAYDNMIGSEKRFKYRIRYYDKENENLFLEKKEKIFGRCYKKSCKITKEEFKIILSKNVSYLFWTTNKELLKKFCLDVMVYDFAAKVIIDYERIAYVEKISNVRVTLDTNITAAYDFDNFLNGNYIKMPLQNNNYEVLEVKFDYILPSYIRNIIRSDGFIQTSFSKYYYGRKKLEEVKR